VSNSLHPKLIVFDLDFTLWDCGGTWCDCLSPPFRSQQDRVLDRGGRHVRFYTDVISILDECDDKRIVTALASRTEQPTWAKELLHLLAATHRFAFSEIYPSSKLKHFSSLREATRVDYGGMLFFDDEMRNIREVSGLGVTSIFVPSGLTRDLFERGLEQFSLNRRTQHGRR
jgi:magnesium-dependent phosphatase 1